MHGRVNWFIPCEDICMYIYVCVDMYMGEETDTEHMDTNDIQIPHNP